MKSGFPTPNPDTSLKIIAKMGRLYNKLERSNQKKLLHEKVNRVFVNPQKTIKRMELRPPFAYLKEVTDRVQNGSVVGFEGKTKTSAKAGQCSSLVSPGTPNRYSIIIRTSEQAVSIILYHLYSQGSTSEQMKQRNDEIRRLAEGITKAEIARQYDLSVRRVGQIIDEKCETTQL